MFNVLLNLFLKFDFLSIKFLHDYVFTLIPEQSKISSSFDFRTAVYSNRRSEHLFHNFLASVGHIWISTRISMTFFSKSQKMKTSPRQLPIPTTDLSLPLLFFLLSFCFHIRVKLILEAFHTCMLICPNTFVTQQHDCLLRRHHLPESIRH